jgi:chromate transporter
LLLALLQFNDNFGAGFLALFWNSLTNKIDKREQLDSADAFPVSKTALLAPTNFNLFLIFLKIGQSYGSGYVFCFLMLN